MIYVNVIFAYIKRALIQLAFLGYVTVIFFGFVHIINMAEMDMSMENCPFSIGEHSLCEMSFVEHIQKWQVFSNVLIPILKILPLVLVVLVFKYFNLPDKRSVFLFYLRIKTPRAHSFFQDLFAKGVLNPKVP